jgi:ABC-type transport system involved in multi-copper enzyme maturation permease subunit
VLAAVNYAESEFPYANTRFSLSLFFSDFPIIFLLCITVASMVFGNEHSNHTMKNSISYGIPRGYIYFSKLIVEMVYALIAFVIIAGLHITSAFLLLENSGTNDLVLLLHTCIVSLPLLFYALAVTNCFIFIIEGTGGAIMATIGLLLVFPQISNYLGMKFIFFQKLSKILPWNLINNIGFDEKANQLMLPWEGTAGYYNYWIFGLIQMLLFTLIGFMIFRKKEIK